MTLQELIEEHIALAEAANQRELAMLEKELWEKVIGMGAKGLLSGEKWFPKNVPGVHQRDFRVRAMLLAMGEPAATPLWERFEKKQMTSSALMGVIFKARKYSITESGTMVEAVVKAMKEYDALPYLRRAPSGIPYRTTGGKPTLKRRKPTKKSAEKEAAESAIFWTDIKARVEKFLKKELTHTDPVVHAELERELMVMLRIVARDFRDSLSKAMEADEHAAKMEKVEEVSKAEVEKACSTLGMDPPQAGKPADLHLAKRNKWRLANEYHPDKTHRDTAELFNSVLASYSTLERYNSQLSKDG